MEVIDTTEFYVYPLSRLQYVPQDISREAYWFGDVTAEEVDGAV